MSKDYREGIASIDVARMHDITTTALNLSNLIDSKMSDTTSKQYQLQDKLRDLYAFSVSPDADTAREVHESIGRDLNELRDALKEAITNLNTLEFLSNGIYNFKR